MFQTTLFLLAWYSLTTTLFQAVQSDMFLVDCKSFFNDLASFIQTFVGWTIDAGHSAAQISTKIPNAFIAGMVYWLLLILIVGICMAGTGMLAILIEIKVIELYKKNCWDVITLLMILTSVAIVIYFGESIKKVLSERRCHKKTDIGDDERIVRSSCFRWIRKKLPDGWFFHWGKDGNQ